MCTRAAMVEKGEAWEGVRFGLKRPLVFGRCGEQGGLVGSSMSAAMTAASKGVALESLSEVPGLGAGLLGADSPAAFPAGSLLAMVCLGCSSVARLRPAPVVVAGRGLGACRGSRLELC